MRLSILDLALVADAAEAGRLTAGDNNLDHRKAGPRRNDFQWPSPNTDQAAFKQDILASYQCNDKQEVGLRSNKTVILSSSSMERVESILSPFDNED